MSEHVYRFNLSIGFPSAEHNETFDLVDDFGYRESELNTQEKVDKVIDREIEEWSHQYIETWTEKQ